MNMNGYQQYKAQSVMTMTPGEMLLLLYDELLKRLNRAEMALDANNEELFQQSVRRCKEIVRYLMDTLDHQYAISGELNNMYNFFIYELSRFEAGRKKEIAEELKPLVKDLRDAFSDAEKKV